jgi:hypothetical protein
MSLRFVGACQESNHLNVLLPPNAGEFYHSARELDALGLLEDVMN